MTMNKAFAFAAVTLAGTSQAKGLVERHDNYYLPSGEYLGWV